MRFSMTKKNLSKQDAYGIIVVKLVSNFCGKMAGQVRSYVPLDSFKHILDLVILSLVLEEQLSSSGLAAMAAEDEEDDGYSLVEASPSPPLALMLSKCS